MLRYDATTVLFVCAYRSALLRRRQIFHALINNLLETYFLFFPGPNSSFSSSPGQVKVRMGVGTQCLRLELAHYLARDAL